MVCITLELIRKKAEHHSASLFELEELSLAQQHISRIELLGRVCPNLKILTLQANRISRLSNLSRLKDLRYLNVAMNRISRCENLQGCESLEKLDMTLNKVGMAELPSLAALRANSQLRRLYLLGNPCTTWSDHRRYVVATLPQLEHLDGVDILRSERICAKRQLPELLQYLQSHRDDTQASPCLSDDDSDTDDSSMATEALETNCLAQSAEATTFSNTADPPVKDDGKPRQKNQGKWPFNLEEGVGTVTLTLSIGRFMRMENIQIDVHTSHIHMALKGQVFCLHLPVEVDTTSMQANHSVVTGILTVCMHTTEGVLRHAQSKKPGGRSLPRCDAAVTRCAVTACEANVHAHEQIPNIIL